MALISTKEVIEYLPELFETNLNGKIDIFHKLEKILIFEEGFIYFANPDSLQLKFIYKKHNNYNINKVFKLNKSLNEYIFFKKEYYCL